MLTFGQPGNDDMKLTTQNGYDLMEVISALQKEIRRGDEEAALYWALELVPHFEAYLWRRLIIIVNEDIGIANPLLLQIVRAQRDTFFECRESSKDGSARLALANVILLMCRSPKTRIADHLQCVVNQDRLHGVRREIPDYALDKHTRRGKNLKRDFEHWLDVGCQLALPALDIPDPYVARARKWWTDPTFAQTDYSNRDRKKSDKRAKVGVPDVERSDPQGELF
ncbi:Replication-associated recombination protein A [Anaerolineae bacterium]|nr:Replication-associated recombination protein A [Anaerolineae bacterium]